MVRNGFFGTTIGDLEGLSKGSIPPFLTTVDDINPALP